MRAIIIEKKAELLCYLKPILKELGFDSVVSRPDSNFSVCPATEVLYIVDDSVVSGVGSFPVPGPTLAISSSRTFFYNSMVKADCVLRRPFSISQFQEAVFHSFEKFQCARDTMLHFSAHVMGYRELKRIDRFHEFKQEINDNSSKISAVILDLSFFFDNLSEAERWWTLSFKKSIGGKIPFIMIGKDDLLPASLRERCEFHLPILQTRKQFIFLQKQLRNRLLFRWRTRYLLRKVRNCIHEKRFADAHELTKKALRLEPFHETLLTLYYYTLDVMKKQAVTSSSVMVPA